MPVDWLFRVYNDIYLYKNPSDFQIVPPVFKHIGKYSSLKGQVRKLDDFGEGKDKNWKVEGRRRYQRSKGNPEAKITSSLNEFFLGNLLENPYGKTGVMWATQPKNGDHIDIMFSKKQIVNRIVFVRGTKNGRDKFCNTKFHVSNSKEGEICLNYQLVGQFEKDIVDYEFNSSQESIWCVRLVLENFEVIPTWFFLEEIAIL